MVLTAAVAMMALTRGEAIASPAYPTVQGGLTQAQRMKWWREARFGMFIHWGLYAIPAGKWGNGTGHGEWIRETAQIPLEEYVKFQGQFNPTKYNADEWARMAKEAGMKYLVITTKHHDGFALFDSKVTDWDVMNTPYGKDIIRDLANACRKHGLKLGFYHSIMDWHHPDYLPRRSWEKNIRPVGDANMDRFMVHLKAQLTELLTNYGDVAVLWFDGEWESTWNDKYGQELFDLVRKLQPKTIVNNRVANNRAGSMEDGGAIRIGDYSTPEQYIPTEARNNADWETCMTMNNNWGYNAVDNNWKSSTTLVRNLVDIASKNGNFLLNVGPKADGTFPAESIQRLSDMGAWMRVNGESVYGTTGGPFPTMPWGRVTQKGNRLYVHVFDRPANGRVELPGLATKVRSARMLATKAAVPAKSEGTNVVLTLPASLPDAKDSVIALDLAGAPVVYRTPKIEADTEAFLTEAKAEVTGGTGNAEYRYTLDGSNPKASSPVVRGAIRITRPGTLKVTGFSAGKPVTGTASKTFTKALPWPSVSVGSLTQGLLLKEATGKWEKVPSLAAFTGAGTAAMSIGPNKAENIGRLYSGYLTVDKDEIYVFELTSDDGSNLWIDGKLVVNNDGLHAAATKRTTLALAKGAHKIDLVWFNATGGSALDLKFAPRGEALRALKASEIGHTR